MFTWDKPHLTHLMAFWEEMTGLWMGGEWWVSCTWARVLETVTILASKLSSDGLDEWTEGQKKLWLDDGTWRAVVDQSHQPGAW